ncbi:hypothetical protein A3F37_04350 [Candidatus Saccharibacteria bacterium RIFCSPHIGHO2_12_FULL_41_12]|nr:MAG: hypothetical protein A3F37_04350 [Candidatus Saccharibacteria bacterium RIFCSPHIGHO2_12_FULL_41_12]
MSDNATKKDLENLGKSLEASFDKKIDKKIDKAVTDLSEIIANFAQQVDVRFNKLESRVDELDKKFDRLLQTIDGFVSRIDSYETENAMRDRQFERLLKWARKVSKKTGIPLENL